MKKILKWRNLKYLVAFLLPIFLVLMRVRAVDNDSWFVLAEGREIWENGVYFEDKLAMHEGLKVIVQNYGFAVIFWLIYSLLGVGGLYMGMLVCFVVILWLLYKIYLLVSDGNENFSLGLMVVTGAMLGTLFVVTRAQMVSYVIFLLVMYILELYARKGAKKLLWAIPLLSLAQINLHASVWLMMFILMAVFVLDTAREDYKAKPIIVVGVVSFLVGLINPYGLEMIWFVVKSYMDGGIQGLVVEMQSFAFTSIWMVMIYVMIASTIALGFFGKSEGVKLRYLLFFIGFLALGLNTVKGMSQMILVMLIPIVPMYKNFRLPRLKNEERARFVTLGFTAVLLGFVGVRLVKTVLELEDEPDAVMRMAVDRLEERVAEKEEQKSEVRLYTGYNDGGYLEFRGYKPYIDPRAEVFLETNNGKEDILVEYKDFLRGKVTREELLEKYDFEYIVAREDDPFNWDGMEEYGFEVIFDDEATETRVYEKKA